MFGFKQDNMSIDIFHKRWDEKIGVLNGITCEEAESFLIDIQVFKNDKINLHDLRYLICVERAPTLENPENTLLISTIHRSKGLEFDAVYLLQPRKNQYDAEEARVRYVALTRASSCFKRLEREKGIFRWGKHYIYGSDYWITDGRILLEGRDDIEAETIIMPDAELPSNKIETIRNVQNILWREYQDGGRLLLLKQDYDNVVDYFLSVPAGVKSNQHDIPLCPVSEDLRRNINKIESMNKIDFKNQKHSVSIEGLFTFAFDINEHSATEIIGTAGLALAPITSGYIT
jgi:hypothetical protein